MIRNPRYGSAAPARPHGGRGVNSKSWSRPVLGAAVAFALAYLSGCAGLLGGTDPNAAAERPYKVVGSKRFVTGPYGNPGEVHATIAAVKSNGAPSARTARAVKPPEGVVLGNVAIFDYQFPDRCGGYTFRVYEGRDLQVLEYSHASDSGQTVVIRYYVVGPSPFIEAGLWTPYDHTAEGMQEMKLLVGMGEDDGMAFLEDVAPDREAVVAGAAVARVRAAVVMGADLRETAAADAAPEEPREQVDRPACALGPYAVAVGDQQRTRGRLALLYHEPEGLGDDAKVGDVLDNPVGFGVQFGDALATLGVLDEALPIPDQAADI